MTTNAQEDDVAVDVVCIGETMALLVESSDPTIYMATTAGAESNVATGLAMLGLRSQWVSRVGDDRLGRLVEQEIAAAGVDVAVVRDPVAPTGVMVKHPAGTETVSEYYRSESAARKLSRSDLERIASSRWIHVTGITPALSPQAHDLVQAVCGGQANPAARVSFDFNYRDRLWESAAVASSGLLPLARAADVVFIGDDEAMDLYGSESTTVLTELLCATDDQELVLKRGGGHASVITWSGEVSVPALSTPAVDTTGAGDAFAAGYLAGHRRGWGVEHRLQLGHFMASGVIGSVRDVPGFSEGFEPSLISREDLDARWSREEDSAHASDEPGRPATQATKVVES